MRMYQKLSNTSHTFLLLLFVLLFSTNSFSQYIFNKNSLPEKLSLHNFTTVADVGQRNLNIQQVIAHYESLNPTKLKTENDDLGFTEDNFWAKVELNNPTASSLEYYLETARPITDLVELYIVDDSGKIIKKVSGDTMRYSERSFDNRKSIFELKIQPKSNLKLFLHLKSDGEVIKIPVMLYSSQSFIKMISNEQLFFGMFYGILSIAAIIYLFFFFALNERIFLYYSLYVLFVGLLQFALDGFFYKYVTPNAGWFSNHGVLFIAIIAVFLSGKYSEVFLKIKTNSKKIYFLFKVAYALLFFLLFCVIFIPSLLLFS